MEKQKRTRLRNSASPDKRRPNYVPGYTFDAARSQRVCRFLESCVTMTEGAKWAGKPMVLMPWQRDVIDSVYGWVDADGRRRIRRARLPQLWPLE